MQNQQHDEFANRIEITAILANRIRVGFARRTIQRLGRPVYIELKHNSGEYDREVFLVLKDFEAPFSQGGDMAKAALSRVDKSEFVIDRAFHIRGTTSPGRRQKMNANDPYDLQRFVDAQRDYFEQVCSELSGDRKQSHWMWFIFPQLKGLGHSGMADRSAISSLREAEAYLRHPTLGPRLRHCTQLVMLVEGLSIERILGSPDDLKFRSSMTLFANTAVENKIFKDALEKYFAGIPDRLTIDRFRVSGSDRQ